MSIIEVKNLTVGYKTNNSQSGLKPVLRDLSFELMQGQTLGICGSSGCGKSTVILALLGMLHKQGGYASGEAMYNGMNLLELDDKQWKTIRWSKLALVPQSAMSAFNPVFTIGKTFAETIAAHKDKKTMPQRQRIARAEELLESVGLSKDTLRRYPHELSGGMKQRMSIALALLLDPEVLMLDEATSGLDVIIEADILKLLRGIQQKRGISIIFVSHDRRVTAEFCHRRIEL